VHGTWLGVTTDGRVAVLTNFAEEGRAQGAVSRGAVVNDFLSPPANRLARTEDFGKSLLAEDSTRAAGHFSLLYGRIGQPLAVVSNRESVSDSVLTVLTKKGQTVVMSNVAFGDRSWSKVNAGERLMKNALRDGAESGETEDELFERLLMLLSTDTLPRQRIGEGFGSVVNQLRESIFIPPIEIGGLNHDSDLHHFEALNGIYGTKEQTVLTIDNSGRVKFLERTLYDEDAKALPKNQRDRVFEFQLHDI
jgi:uncharacterized protein with NRDE domain